jgi:hypothetical protein
LADGCNCGVEMERDGPSAATRGPVVTSPVGLLECLQSAAHVWGKPLALVFTATN